MKAVHKHIGADETEILECVDDLYAMLKGTKWAAEKAVIVRFLRENYNI